MTQTSGETRGTESNGGAGVSKPFRLISEFEPRGDQPAAIEKLVAGVEQGRRDQVLLGVTGSGKTFTMAHVIARTQRPTLIMAPNKTLAAQLYSEFRALFPENAVEYFVSYYDYYQPEAYIPGRDLYIEKDASINEQIDRMRHSATRSILERSDVIVVASVSCIYGLGSPGEYQDMAVTLSVGDEIDRDDVLRKLTCMQYRRNPVELQRGTFRARGDVLEILPVYEDDRLVRIEFTNSSFIGPRARQRSHTWSQVIVSSSSHTRSSASQAQGRSYSSSTSPVSSTLWAGTSSASDSHSGTTAFSHVFRS